MPASLAASQAKLSSSQAITTTRSDFTVGRLFSTCKKQYKCALVDKEKEKGKTENNV